MSALVYVFMIKWNNCNQNKYILLKLIVFENIIRALVIIRILFVKGLDFEDENGKKGFMDTYPSYSAINAPL